jgi:3-deoxy-D-manno-octulosonic-acid transferase
MEQQIIEIGNDSWQPDSVNADWIAALEAGKVLYFPRLAFELTQAEQRFLTPEARDPKARNISLGADGKLKGAAGDAAAQAELAAMIGRFRKQAQSLIDAILPRYSGALRLAPTSYRPMQVESRAQSWRADDRRLHVDSFPSRPNYGERILRVFANLNPQGVPRVWRVGEPFEQVAQRFLPRAKPYRAWQARLLNALHVTKSLRSEYDHLMLQLHDGMKSDLDYQQSAQQVTMPFAAGSVWVCFSDQASHAVMSGQFMMEQTLHLAADKQYDPAASPLAILDAPDRAPAGVMRALYSLAWRLALPVVLLRLWWRGRREPGYRRHIAERLGFYRGPSYALRRQPVIWVHAVSVGETRAAEPLVDALLRHYPEHVILLTHMTPTGRATGKALFASYAARVVQSYLPYDIGSMVKRFLKHFSPQVCILIETEVWPNTVAQCVQQGVPVALVNARLSARSLAKGQRMATLMGEAARSLSCVAAQTAADAARLTELGVRNAQVTGSIKFDVEPPLNAAEEGAALRSHFGSRPVLLCASTRDGEEVLILDALREVDLGDALLLIVPRHPQRFNEVARLIASRGLSMVRRSAMEGGSFPPGVRVLLGDSMGEMFTYYAACDVAFIGGSLLPLGGQNLIEASALGKPVLLGPHTFNFSVVSDDALEAGAALRVQDSRAMLREAANLLNDPARSARMGANALAFAAQHRGAAQRTMALLQPLVAQ